MALVGSAIELQIDLVNAGRSSLRREVLVLRETDAVGHDADPVESDAFRVADGIEEVMRDRRLTTSKQNIELALRLERTRALEDLPDIVHRELMDVRSMVGIHEAGEHFRLHRLVRSTMSARPRPVLIVMVRGRERSVVQHVKSWPK